MDAAQSKQTKTIDPSSLSALVPSHTKPDRPVDWQIPTLCILGLGIVGSFLLNFSHGEEEP